MIGFATAGAQARLVSTTLRAAGKLNPSAKIV